MILPVLPSVIVIFSGCENVADCTLLVQWLLFNSSLLLEDFVLLMLVENAYTVFEIN